MIYKENLGKMRTNMQERIEFVRKEISGSPPGYILKTRHGQRDEYIHIFYKKGRRVRKRVKPDSKTAENLLRKKILEIELEILEENYRKICGVVEEHIAFSTEFAIEQLPENLREDYRRILLTESKKTEAGVGPNQSDFMKEGRTHITSRGLRVRSKSELIIVEKLYEYGLAFRYEEVKVLGNFTVVPDFTIRRQDGKVFYWEHCGRTQDKKYMDHHHWKMELYERNGIVPWDNLIVTYDDVDGNLNLAAVEGEIKAKLLV